MNSIMDNTLFLPVKQEVFNAIISGKKKSVAREIKDTTFRKHLATWSEGDKIRLYYDQNLMSGEPVSEIYIYNNGVYPYIPLEYSYLKLSVGNDSECDTLIVEVEEISFEPVLQNNGYPIRFNILDGDFKPCKNGDYCFWNVVYRLGKVIEIKHKKSGSEHIIT